MIMKNGQRLENVYLLDNQYEFIIGIDDKDGLKLKRVLNSYISLSGSASGTPRCIKSLIRSFRA